MNISRSSIVLATVSFGLGTALLCVMPWPAQAQQPRTAGPAGAPPRGAGLGIYPEYEPDDNTGFVPIFDGKTLTGWDGDPTFWRVENGEIVGETTPDRVVKVNNFLIWRGGTVKDFELKCDFKLNGTNSGIQPQFRNAGGRKVGAQGVPGRYGHHERFHWQPS